MSVSESARLHHFPEAVWASADYVLNSKMPQVVMINVFLASTNGKINIVLPKSQSITANKRVAWYRGRLMERWM